MFILAEQRDNDPSLDCWQRYRAYLDANRAAFPPRAFELATSDWYFSGNANRSPHDAWLRRLTVDDNGSTTARSEGAVRIEIELLGPYHDGHILLSYPDVRSYRLDGASSSRGLGDWRYDEFRLTDDGTVLHAIEWWSVDSTNTWLIEASDVIHEWRPFDETTS